MKRRPWARLRGVLLRWDRLLIAVSLALPFMVPFLLGFLWLTEHNWLLPYLGVSIAVDSPSHRSKMRSSAIGPPSALREMRTRSSQ